MSEYNDNWEAELREVENNAYRLVEGDESLSVDELRAIYKAFLDGYCGEYSDGEYSYSEGADYLKRFCLGWMKERGLKPSPRNWAYASSQIIPWSFAFGPF